MADQAGEEAAGREGGAGEEAAGGWACQHGGETKGRREGHCFCQFEAKIECLENQVELFQEALEKSAGSSGESEVESVRNIETNCS